MNDKLRILLTADAAFAGAGMTAAEGAKYYRHDRPFGKARRGQLSSGLLQCRSGLGPASGGRGANAHRV